MILFHCLLLLFYGHVKRNTRVGTDMFQETFTSQESISLEHELANLVSNRTGGEHSRLCWPVQRRVAGLGGVPCGFLSGGRLLKAKQVDFVFLLTQGRASSLPVTWHLVFPSGRG